MRNAGYMLRPKPSRRMVNAAAGDAETPAAPAVLAARPASTQDLDRGPVHGLVPFGLIYALCIGQRRGAAIFLWWATAGLLDRQVEVAIHADAQNLAERWQEGGIPSLAQRSRSGWRECRRRCDLSADQRDIGGSPAIWTHWPPSGSGRAGRYELPVERDGIRSLAQVRAFDLPGGYHLLVGRDVRYRAQLRRLLTDALFWALFIVIALRRRGGRRHAQTVPPHARQHLGDRGGDLGRQSRPARAATRPRRRIRPARRDDQRHARPHRAADGRVRQVSNAIAHDLRTPITRARARLEDAGAHARDAEDSARRRGARDRRSRRVVAVFEAAADRARSRPAPPLRLRRLDVAPLLTEVAELYGAAAEERGISAAGRDPRARCGIRRLSLIQQGIANLVDNALKFSPRAAA